MKEFKTIKQFSKYEINKKGLVRRKSDHFTPKQIKGLNGYINVTLTNDKNKRYGIGIHRLLMLAWVEIPERYRYLPLCYVYVNHIDGDKLNNDLSNLEWCTARENMKHASEHNLSEKWSSLEVRDVKSGTVSKFDSVRECARSINITKDAIVHRLKFPQTRIWPEGNQYRLVTDNIGDWDPIPGTTKPDLFGFTKGEITVRDVLDKKIYVFNNANHASKELNISPAALSLTLSTRSNKLIKGRYQVKYCKENVNWSNVEIPEYYFIRITNSKGVTKDILTKREASRYTKIPRSTISWEFEKANREQSNSFIRNGFKFEMLKSK